MRKSQSVFVLVFMFLFTAGMLAQSAEQKNLTGRWEGQRENEGRSNAIVLTIDGSAKAITATVTYNGQPYDTANIEFAKDVLTFDAVGLHFTCAVTGNTMKFTAHRGPDPLWDVTLTKAQKR